MWTKVQSSKGLRLGPRLCGFWAFQIMLGFGFQLAFRHGSRPGFESSGHAHTELRIHGSEP